MTYYVVDTTMTPPMEQRFQTYPEVVSYLEQMSKRAYGQSRKDRMILLESIGYGEDDRTAVTFVRSMAEQFNVGIIREGRRLRCDITTATLFRKEEFGN